MLDGRNVPKAYYNPLFRPSLTQEPAELVGATTKKKRLHTKEADEFQSLISTKLPSELNMDEESIERNSDDDFDSEDSDYQTGNYLG